MDKDTEESIDRLHAGLNDLFEKAEDEVAKTLEEVRAIAKKKSNWLRFPLLVLDEHYVALVHEGEKLNRERAAIFEERINLYREHTDFLLNAIAVRDELILKCKITIESMRKGG